MATTLVLDDDVADSLRKRLPTGNWSAVANEMLRAALSEADARWEQFKRITKPIADGVAAEGMTEDEVAAFLEEEKHAMRVERQTRQAS